MSHRTGNGATAILRRFMGLLRPAGKYRGIPGNHRWIEPLENRQLLAGHVIEISVDGLRSDALTQLGQSQLPNIYQLLNEGSATLNARADYDYTETLPNHTDIITARPVLGTYGNGVTFNIDTGGTVHDAAGHYVTSAFDIVHDNGLRTALYASKDKFAFFDRSWDGTNGRVDPIGADNGRDKIDTYLFNADTNALNTSFISAMQANPFNYALVHYLDPDSAGHASGWMSTNYLNAVKKVDGLVGAVLNMISSTPALTGDTDVILVADHGGTGTGHADATLAVDYTVPFIVWGPDASAGGDLYAMNPTSRQNPGTSRLNNTVVPQPIHNGDGVNLATDLLNLGAIDGSLFNNQHDLVVQISQQPPVANGDSYTCQYGTTLNVAAPGVLGNDSDPNNDPLTAAPVDGPLHGSLTLNSNGSFSYTPAAGYSGPDSFTYVANDGLADSNVATVNINVLGQAQSFYATSETTVSGTRVGSLANTQASDNSYEALTEVVSGRKSILEHKWTFANVAAGGSVTFFVEAYHSGTEDDFKFQYSTDGNTWIDMLTVTKRSDDNTAQSYSLPANTSGTVYVRVLDTNRANNKKVLDTLYVDRMYIQVQ